MQPDKLYAPDAPDTHETTLYVMKTQDGKCRRNILTCKNGHRVQTAWKEYVDGLKSGKTAILYQSIYKIDLHKLNKKIISQICYYDFCATPDILLETMNDWADGSYATCRHIEDNSWSTPIYTLDENKIIEIQTKIIKYIDCKDFNIYQIPDGYQIVFKNDNCQSEILQVIREYVEMPSLELLLPIAWQTKQ